MDVSRLSILVVDDEATVRSVVSELIGGKGHRCVTAVDGREAVRHLDREPFHLVLSDIYMPRMDGMELLDHVIAHHPGTRVLLFTGFGTIANAVEAMKRGAMGYITKPIDFEALGEEIEQLAVDLDLSSSGGQLMNEMLRRFEQDLPASRNKRMRNLVDLAIRRIADAESSVLITGESGTGKELMAALIHRFSSRRDKPFVKVNAAALPESLLESELFGHVRGAFTGAVKDRAGRFAEADRGTLFLDEIGEMSPAMQAKLLRVLQEREFEPVGSNRSRRVDVRLITATNRDLRADRREGRFRTDLLYRLNVLEIRLPPLRERIEDLPELVNFILARVSRKLGRRPPLPERAFLDRLGELDWPGNIRELENLLERCLVLGGGDRLGLADLPEDYRAGDLPGGGTGRLSQPGPALLPGLADLTLEEARELFEKQFLVQILEEEQGNVSACARRLGIARKNLQAKLKKYTLDPARFRPR